VQTLIHLHDPQVCMSAERGS